MLGNLSKRGKALFVVGLLLFGLGAGVGFFHPDAQQTQYEYQVKSEQIEASAGYNGTAVPIENLSEAEQDAIFRAYKNSDAFLEGSSAYVQTDEPLNLTEDERWQAVEIEGVRVLVGIHGPEKYRHMTALGGISIASMIVGMVILMLTIFIAAEP